jgi:hypothetical protein
MGGVFSGPAAIRLIEEARQAVPPVRSVADATLSLAAAVAFGEAIVIAMLGLGLITVRILHGRLFLLDLGSLAAGLVLGLVLSLALAALAGWVTLAFSAGAAQLSLRAAFVALLIAFFLRSRWLPDVAWTASAITLGAAVVLLALLFRSLCKPGTRVEAQ